MQTVHLDMGHKGPSTTTSATAPAAANKPSWATDFTSLFNHHRVCLPLEVKHFFWHVLPKSLFGRTASLPFLISSHPSFVLQIVVASGERDLWFYDLTSYEPLLVVRPKPGRGKRAA
jgi:hypothetical protein